MSHSDQKKKMEGKKITFTFLYFFQCHDTACGCATAVAIATTSGIMFTSSSYITPPTRGGGRTTTTTAAEQDKERPPLHDLQQTGRKAGLPSWKCYQQCLAQTKSLRV